VTEHTPTVPAVLVDRVSKTFEIPREQVNTLKERALHPFRRSGHEVLRALREVSMSIEPGEFFGIVGRNGSGKSTLLKCLAGIYAADQGDIYVNGRLSAFIELGVGFNPDLAARDNARRAGASTQSSSSPNCRSSSTSRSRTTRPGCSSALPSR
jgi:ABC-type polysaccharide/polyol phosphate transport system ATPase subunit